MMKKCLSTLLVFVVSLSAVCAQSFSAEAITLPDSKLKNFYRIDEGVYRSEQPTKKDFKALEEFGIEEVLNLRRWHSDEDEVDVNSPLILHRIKTNAHSIDANELVEALRVIRNRQGPILIHCRHGSDRTGAVVAMYRIVFQDVSKEEAIAEMKEGDFGFHSIYVNIVRTIRKIDVDAVKARVFAD